jgi:protein ImuB
LADEKTAVLIDRLTNRLGSNSVFRLEEVASHIPERAQWRISALHRRARAPADEAAISEVHHASHAIKPPRPAFLLEPAEPISVIAAVPDGPPARFTWRRVMRRVVHSEGPERIAPEWWRLIGELPGHGREAFENEVPGDDAGLGGLALMPKSSGRIRDYYRVEDEHGGIYWIYRAGLYPEGLRPDDTYPDDAAHNAADGDAAGAAPVTVMPPAWYLQGLF